MSANFQVFDDKSKCVTTSTNVSNLSPGFRLPFTPAAIPRSHDHNSAESAFTAVDFIKLPAL